MLDLIWGYLLIIAVLFSANIGLFLGNSKLNDLKSSLFSIVIGIFLFIIVYISKLFSFNLLDYFTYIFLAMAIIIFAVLILYLKNKNWKNSILIIIFLFYASSFLLASQVSEYSLFYSSLLSVFSIISTIIAFQSSKLLKFAKRSYDVIIGEYMSLEGVLIFLFALTYMSVIQLDYKMFSSFLILTPTYQLVYVIIGIVIILIIGSYWNDKKI